MESFSKNHEIIAYLAKSHPSASITVLMKLSYLVDLVSVKKLGQPISSFTYIRYNYGPFAQEIYGVVEDLVQNRVVEPKNDYASVGVEYVTYCYKEDGDFSFDKITEEEKSIIDDFLCEFKGYGAKTLTEIAYKTKPMVKLGATLGGKEHLFEELDLSAR